VTDGCSVGLDGNDGDDADAVTRENANKL